MLHLRPISAFVCIVSATAVFAAERYSVTTLPFVPNDINQAGHIVGGAAGTNGYTQIWVYRDGTVTNLPHYAGGAVTEIPPTGTHSGPISDINNAGEIVGYWLVSAGGRAMSWHCLHSRATPPQATSVPSMVQA